MKLNTILSVKVAMDEMLPFKGFPMKAGYIVQSVGKQIIVEHQLFEERRLEVVQRLGKEVMDEEGKPTGNWSIETNNLDFQKEYSEMMTLDVDIKIPEKLTIEDLSAEYEKVVPSEDGTEVKTIEKLHISPVDILNLIESGILEDPTDAEKDPTDADDDYVKID